MATFNVYFVKNIKSSNALEVMQLCTHGGLFKATRACLEGYVRALNAGAVYGYRYNAPTADIWFYDEKDATYFVVLSAV